MWAATPLADGGRHQIWTDVDPRRPLWWVGLLSFELVSESAPRGSTAIPNPPSDTPLDVRMIRLYPGARVRSWGGVRTATAEVGCVVRSGRSTDPPIDATL